MYFKRFFFFPSQFLGEGKELLGSTTIVRESPRKKLVPHSYRTKHVFGLFGKRRKIPARCGRRCFLFLVVAVLLLQRADTKLTYCTSQYKRWVDHAFCRTCHTSVGGLTRSTPIDAALFFFFFFFFLFFQGASAKAVGGPELFGALEERGFVGGGGWSPPPSAGERADLARF